MNEPPVTIPRVDEIFEKMAIRMEDGPSRVYAYTDKVGGFWEGRTFGYGENGGYTIGGERLLTDVFIIKNGTLLDRRKANEVVVLPHQIRHTWKDGSYETLTILSGQPGLVIEIGGRNIESWRIVPLVQGEDRFKPVRSEEAGAIALKDPGTGMYILMGSGAPGSWEPPQTPLEPYPDAAEGNYLIPYHFVVSNTDSVYFIVLFGTKPETLDARMGMVASSPTKYIELKKNDIGGMLLDSYFETGDQTYDTALHWAKVSGDALVVTQFGTGIWAGLPWFNQSWGRDTFIALPGISLVTGQFEEAAEIIRSFAAYQITDPENELFGRVPNRVNSPGDIIYNTTDGTPWLIREIAEYALYTGDTTFVREMYPVIERAIEGALKYFVDDLGFMTHDDADTWMDARIRGEDPWSPRGDRAVDIQTLWYTQLRASTYLARILGRDRDAIRWEELAETVRNNFVMHFWNPHRNSLYDHLNEDGSPDTQIRPNQIFALTIPLFGDLVDPERAQGVVREVVTELTYPYGVASLSQDDPFFHPYHHDRIYHFDAAYHNGMCWHWNVGAVVGGMVRTGYVNAAFELTRNLADQLLNLGTPGSLSELVEPAPKQNGSLTLTGTYSQAWSVSEFVRNFYQDYLGIRVNMLERRIMIAPRLPDSLKPVHAVIPFGMDERIMISLTGGTGAEEIEIQSNTLRGPVTAVIELSNTSNHLYEIRLEITDDKTSRFRLMDPEQMICDIDGSTMNMTRTGRNIPQSRTDISFKTFSLNPDLKTVLIPDYLEQIILSQNECE